MTKHRSITFGNPIPQDFLDAIQELIGSYLSPNAVLTVLNGTTIQLSGGADNAQVGLAINGRWRYNATTVNGTFTSGSAGSYPIWATASDNSFVIGPPETDLTVYSFALAIQTATPGTALSRQIGTIQWNGSAITDANLLGEDPAANGNAVPGDIIFSGAPTRPGALLCDGSSIVRTAQPALFAAIGTTYGTVDGTHFTLPDYRGRFPIGAGTGSGLTARTAGTTGGEETHLLTAAESGTTAHTHASGGSAAVTGRSGNDSPDHVHNVPFTTGVAGGTTLASVAGGHGNDWLTSSAGANTTHTHDAGSYAVTDPATPAATPASASSAHNNMPPFLPCYVFIKT